MECSEILNIVGLDIAVGCRGSTQFLDVDAIDISIIVAFALVILVALFVKE